MPRKMVLIPACDILRTISSLRDMETQSAWTTKLGIGTCGR